MPVPYDGLLMLAGFDCSTPDQLKTAYWAPRFMLTIPPILLEPLKVSLFSFLPQLRQQVSSMSPTAKEKLPSAPFNLETMEFIGASLVQDTLELADTAPENPLVARLRVMPQWQLLQAGFQKARASGVSGLGEGLGAWCLNCTCHILGPIGLSLPCRPLQG